MFGGVMMGWDRGLQKAFILLFGEKLWWFGLL